MVLGASRRTLRALVDEFVAVFGGKDATATIERDLFEKGRSEGASQTARAAAAAARGCRA